MEKDFQSSQSTYLADAATLIKDVKNKKVIRYDNWSNIMTGLNKKFDKSRYTTFSAPEILDDLTLSYVWAGNGLGKKIVSVRPDDMTREWLEIENDPDKLINNEFDRLNVETHINEALKWRALFGGAINVIGLSDGGDLETPVNEKSIKSVDWIRTYSRIDCYITEFNFERDQKSPNYGELKFITIEPKYGAAFNVDVSRCLIWKGIPLPSNISDTGTFYYWGVGELQAGWNELKNLGAGMNHLVKILFEFIIGKYKINGLTELIAENNRSQVEEIIAVIELAKSTINATLIDTDDDYQRDSANVSGLPELIDRFMIMVSSAYDYPVTKLFGRSAAGMNATGEGDEDNYYDSVRSKQKTLMKNPIRKLMNYINISLGNKIKEPKIKFNSLYQQTQKEELECKEKQANIDKIYIDAGVLTPDEVAENRFGGDGYSFETKIDLLSRDNIMELENEELKNQIEEMKKSQLSLPNNNQNNLGEENE